MEIKYCGAIPNTQAELVKEQLHSKIHRLLIFKEDNCPTLDKYFTSLLFRIGGLNSLCGYPVELIELLSVLEGAYLECSKDNCNFKAYRKAIFDAHQLVDRMPINGGDEDGDINQ